MPLSKFLALVVLLAAAVATIVFAFFPEYRPAFIKDWFPAEPRADQGSPSPTSANARSATGAGRDDLLRAAPGRGSAVGPTQGPIDVLTRFQKAIRERNYDDAVLCLDGDYAEEFQRGSKAAKKLGQAIDDLSHQVEDVANLRSPTSKVMLRYLDPWPKDFRFKIDHTPGQNNATALIAIDVLPPEVAKPNDLRGLQGWKMEPKIRMSLVPLDAYLFDAKKVPVGLPVKLGFDPARDKGWRIFFPTSAMLHDKVAYLAEQVGKYTRALHNLQYGLQHEAMTKADFEAGLRKELEAAK
jgi:hypothetical protein